ncbi:hypothetical protein ANCDUO_14603 [Ancylostoma duodenale]|uniref:Peptidase A2 domain-containing protein n=1 Tax=Ancylostoma duodenale TaxID=51022 RepID=A0A0C2GDS3_9BILA|nr:hypothetical protein ANCDUO_14603 [Ancylostoma duodenale]
MLATGNANRFLIAVIPIKVNDINILALVDTGAAITTTSDAAAPLLGVFRFDQSDIPWAVGMAGVPTSKSTSSATNQRLLQNRMKESLYLPGDPAFAR